MLLAKALMESDMGICRLEYIFETIKSEIECFIPKLSDRCFSASKMLRFFTVSLNNLQNSGAIAEFPFEGFEGGWGGNIVKKLFKKDGFFNLHFSIYTLSRIDIDNDYDNCFIVDTIKNPKVTNSYSKKFFTGAVDSFGIVGNRIFGKFFDGFDDSLAVFGIKFFDEILRGGVQKNLKHVRVPVLF
jgi:hypothetical protein